jgi:dynein heavy chain 1
MIRTLVTETYGGKIDDEGDYGRLRQLVSSILTTEAYDIGHKLVEGVAGSGLGDGDDGSLTVPSGTGMQEFMEWINRLPEREPPTYLGLPANAEKLVLVSLGKSMIADLGKITEMLDEGEQLMVEDETTVIG